MYTRKLQSALHCMIADISAATGNNVVETRETLKAMYWGDREGTMSLKLGIMTYTDAQLFYEFLLDTSLDLGIAYCTWANDEHSPRSPLSWGFDQEPLIKLCIKHRVCCITMQAGADIHHVDKIGMGEDRGTVDHSKYILMPLCREKHNECHNMGQALFENKYNVRGVKLTPQEIELYNIG